MSGDRLTVDGSEWLVDITEHWPPGGPEDRPAALDVRFYDPGDRQQWVSNSWIPFPSADLSDDGLYQLFLEADTRAWRDAHGECWRIRIVRAGDLQVDGTGGLYSDGIVTFEPRDPARSRTFRSVVAELPPVGCLGNDQIERLLPRARAAASDR